MSELPPPIDDPEDEPLRTHHYTYRADINDWWCDTEGTVSDFCVELNDFGQGNEPKEVI